MCCASLHHSGHAGWHPGKRPVRVDTMSSWWRLLACAPGTKFTKVPTSGDDVGIDDELDAEQMPHGRGAGATRNQTVPSSSGPADLTDAAERIAQLEGAVAAAVSQAVEQAEAAVAAREQLARAEVKHAQELEATMDGAAANTNQLGDSVGYLQRQLWSATALARERAALFSCIRQELISAEAEVSLAWSQKWEAQVGTNALSTKLEQLTVAEAGVREAKMASEAKAREDKQAALAALSERHDEHARNLTAQLAAAHKQVMLRTRSHACPRLTSALRPAQLTNIIVPDESRWRARRTTRPRPGRNQPSRLRACKK